MQTTLSMLRHQSQQLTQQLIAAAEAIDRSGTHGVGTWLLHWLRHDVSEHFALQAAVLFPVLSRHPCVVRRHLPCLQSERETLGSLVTQLEDAIHHADARRQRACATTVLEVLFIHMLKQDAVLFPLAGLVLDRREQAELKARAAAAGPDHPAARAVLLGWGARASRAGNGRSRWALA